MGNTIDISRITDIYLRKTKRKNFGFQCWEVLDQDKNILLTHCDIVRFEVASCSVEMYDGLVHIWDNFGEGLEFEPIVNTLIVRGKIRR